MTTKRARLNAIRLRRIEVRTFAGYIGLEDGRPVARKDAYGNRVVEVLLNERRAHHMYSEVCMVTVTGPWTRKASR